MSNTSDLFDPSIPVLSDVVVPGRPEFARAPGAAYRPEPAGAAPSADYDAELIADRIRERFTSFLSGDGRDIVEDRCRDALREHSSWLVHQITREVAIALEAQMSEWVREAVEEELLRRGTL